MANLPTFIRQDQEPLYPRVLYNRPVTRQGAGRLLVIGGHSGEFSLPTAVHQLALAAGVGECRAVLPESLVKFVGGAPGTTFVAASPSGSLGTEALGRILELAEEADAMALGASLSSNSHTAILMERVLQEAPTPVVLFGDALTALAHHSRRFTERENCLVVATMPEMFRLAGHLGVAISIRRDGGLINKLEIIRDIAAASKCSYAVYGTEIITAAAGELVVTPVNYRLSLLPAAYYGVFATTWLQNRTRPQEGLATGAYILREASLDIGQTTTPTVADMAAKIQLALSDHV